MRNPGASDAASTECPERLASRKADPFFPDQARAEQILDAAAGAGLPPWPGRLVDGARNENKVCTHRDFEVFFCGESHEFLKIDIRHLDARPSSTSPPFSWPRPSSTGG